MISILKTLAIAIKEKKIIKFDYKLEWMRLWNPHAVYNHIKTWNILLDLYQTNWYTNSNEKLPWWREFNINEISKINILSDTFNITNWYNSNSERYNDYINKI